MRYTIKNGNVCESFWIDAPYDSKQDALEAIKQGVIHNCERCGIETCDQLPNFIKYNRSDMLHGLSSIVAELKPLLSADPEEFTEHGSDEPSVDVRLCIDLDLVSGPSWIIRTGLPDYDQRHSEYCASGSVNIDTDPNELLSDLINQLN